MKTRSQLPASALGDLLDHGRRERRSTIRSRIETLVASLGSADVPSDSSALLSTLEAALADPHPDTVWLVLAVMTARLPTVPDVLRTLRTARLDGPLPSLLTALRDSGELDGPTWSPVEVITGRVLVDLHHTARNLFATGIQRVARETARRWDRDHDLVVVGWTEGYQAFRRLSDAEIGVGLSGVGDGAVPVRSRDGIVVPWKCRHLVPELPAEPERARRYQAFARFSGSITGAIGFDCVPVMAAETSAEGMSAAFALYLAAAAHFDRIATISEASGVEYRGWRTMLGGIGEIGPDIRAVPLPIDAATPSPSAVQEAGEVLGRGTLPVVLVVGSHEPRKNHLAILHAAEILWREGVEFTLAFVGGNSWKSEHFSAQVETLRQGGRSVQTIVALPDDLLWAAYRLAYCTVFPSLHEGFGLPVAESLASGTPVITSNFGSMQEIAGHGGALLVDPRNDQDLTDALRRLLLDQGLRDQLAGEAAALPLRSWDDYAAATWEYLAGEGPAAEPG